MSENQVIVSTPFDLELAQLESLGFNQRVKNLFLLRKTNGNVDVVAKLLEARRNLDEAIQEGKKEKKCLKKEIKHWKKRTHDEKEYRNDSSSDSEGSVSKMETKKLKNEIKLIDKNEKKERKLLIKLAKKHGLNFKDDDSESSDDEKALKKEEKKAAKQIKKQEKQAYKKAKKQMKDENESSSDDDNENENLNKRQLKCQRIEKRIQMLKSNDFMKFSPEKKLHKIAKLENKLNKLQNRIQNNNNNNEDSSDVEKSLQKEKKKAMKEFKRQVRHEHKLTRRSSAKFNAQDSILKSFEHVYLDGTNLLFVLGALRTSIVNGNLAKSQCSLEELVKCWLIQNPQLSMCSLIFEEMKGFTIDGRLRVSGVGPEFSSLDSAMNDWCQNSGIDKSKIVVFTNDKSLTQELNKLGVTVYKSNKWFELAAESLTRGDDLFDREEWIIQWFEQASISN